METFARTGVQNTHQTHTGCGIPGLTAQVKDAGFLVDRKSPMSQQREVAASKANVTIASANADTMGGGGYSQVSFIQQMEFRPGTLLQGKGC